MTHTGEKLTFQLSRAFDFAIAQLKASIDRFEFSRPFCDTSFEITVRLGQLLGQVSLVRLTLLQSRQGLVARFFSIHDANDLLTHPFALLRATGTGF